MAKAPTPVDETQIKPEPPPAPPSTKLSIQCGKKMPHIIDYEDDDGNSQPIMRSCLLKLGHDGLHKISTPIKGCFITWK